MDRIDAIDQFLDALAVAKNDRDTIAAADRYAAAIQPGPREAALIAERAQPGDPCTHAINSDCPHYE